MTTKKPATAAQLEYIKVIEAMLPASIFTPFTGTTREEAFLWIHNHQERYKLFRGLNCISKSYRNIHHLRPDERGSHSVSQGFFGDETDFN